MASLNDYSMLHSGMYIFRNMCTYSDSFRSSRMLVLNGPYHYINKNEKNNIQSLNGHLSVYHTF